MAAASGLKAFWLSWFSKPAGDRLAYRLIRTHKPRKMMMLGLGDATRALRMISLAARYHPADQINFAGIDRFDSRPVDVPHLSLKEAYKLLRPTGSRINLIPGDAGEALARAASALHSIELVVISADQEPLPARGWSFLSRLLASNSVVLREECLAEGTILKSITRLELDRLSAPAVERRRAA